MTLKCILYCGRSKNLSTYLVVDTANVGAWVEPSNVNT